jgi:hypothetical protein
MTNAVSFITDMVSVLELSSNRVPHKKIRQFCSRGGEFCSKMSLFLSENDLEILRSTIDTINCSESLLRGEQGVIVCKKLLHIIEVLLKRISILEKEKNDLEIFLQDILQNISETQDMDDSEVTMELLIQQNNFLQDELANLKCTTSKLQEDLNSEKTKTRDFEWLQKQSVELFDELVSHSTRNCGLGLTHSFECDLFKFAKCESFSNESESIIFDPNTATNSFEDFEATLKVDSPAWKEGHVLKDKDSLLWLVIVISSSATLKEELHRLRQRFPKVRFVLREENYLDTNMELAQSLPESFIPNYDAIEQIDASRFAHIIKGICYGPQYKDNDWVEHTKVLWIFSHFKGFVPVDYELSPNCFVLEYSPMKLTTFLETDEEFNIFSGLRLYAKEKRGKLTMTSSCGILCSRNVNGQTMQGVLTTKHGYYDGEIVQYKHSSSDIRVDLGYIRYLTTKNFASLTSGELIECDFCFVEFILSDRKYEVNVGDCDLQVDELTPVDMRPISTISNLQTLKENFIKNVSKSGATTRVTQGRILGKYIDYTSDFLSRKTDVIYDGLNAKVSGRHFCWTHPCNGCYLCKGCSFLLIYCCENFANKGDSGGLCWYETETKNVHAIGLIIGRVEKYNLYCVLPLSFIAEACPDLIFQTNDH